MRELLGEARQGMSLPAAFEAGSGDWKRQRVVKELWRTQRAELEQHIQHRSHSQRGSEHIINCEPLTTIKDSQPSLSLKLLNCRAMSICRPFRRKEARAFPHCTERACGARVCVCGLMTETASQLQSERSTIGSTAFGLRLSP